MIRVLVFVLLVFSINNSFAKDARSRVLNNHKKQSKQYKQKKRTKYSFTYNQLWFSKLNKNQKKKYLDVLAKLSKDISKSDKSYSSNELMKLLIPEAYGRFNNGFVYDSNFSSLVTQDAYGEYFPSCPSGQRPCAIYTGLVNGKAACSPNSTPTCVERGNRSELLSKLEQCNGSNSTSCTKLRALMESSTKGVSDFCNKSNVKNQKYCQDAMKALEEAKVSLPPVPGESPEGENCNEVSSFVQQKVEAGRQETDRNGNAIEHYNNNQFWRNITNAARQSCGNRPLPTMARVIGTCNIADFRNASMDVHQVVTYKKGDDGFNDCIETRKSELEAHVQQLEQRYNAAEDNTQDKINLKAQLESAKNSLSNVASRNECTSQGPNSVSVGDAMEYTDQSRLSTVYRKISQNQSLTTEDENVFRAATGMSTRSFKSAFCDSQNLNSFKNNLSRLLANVPSINGILTSSATYQGFVDQVKTANTKMKMCLRNLESVATTQCGYHPVKDANALRSATADKPILARNKATGKCVAITGYRRDSVTTAGRDEAGNPNTRLVTALTVEVPGKSATIVEMTEQQYARENELQTYACKNDSRPHATYCETDPEKIDPGQSVPEGCTNPHDGVDVSQ